MTWWERLLLLLPLVPGPLYRRSERRRVKATVALERLQRLHATLAERDRELGDHLARCALCPWR